MLTRRLYFKLMILPMGSVIIYIILFIFMLYPTDAEIQQANNDLNSLLNEPGETEIGFGFRISIANVNFVPILWNTILLQIGEGIPICSEISKSLYYIFIKHIPRESRASDVTKFFHR